MESFRNYIDSTARVAHKHATPCAVDRAEHNGSESSVAVMGGLDSPSSAVVT